MYTYEETIDLVREAVSRFAVNRQPKRLYEPVEYALACGGKRLRPTLALLAYNMYKEDVKTALQPALALETYHNHTLLHDDLMDNADMRRGRATVHRRWDANTAILSGDAMLVYAMQMMMGVDDRHLRAAVELFAETALEICEGQQMDMDFEARTDVTEQEYMEMIRLKTSVLLACALKLGAMLADAPAEDVYHLYAFGERLGLAFQLQDDYLDVYGDPATFGKRIGGDILCGKKTFMLINALLHSDDEQRAQLLALLAQRPETDDEQQRKIDAVVTLYNIIGVADMAEKCIEKCFMEAEAHLDRVVLPDERKEQMRRFAHSLMGRVR